MSEPQITLDPSQQKAVELMCSERLGIVTGGPGVGKTTCTRMAIEQLEERGAIVALAAPTGKASRRMEEATGRKAQTVHRLLRYGLGPNGGFLYGADYPLEVDVVFVDEASMLCTELADSLFAAVQGDTRLVLIGDKDQLPSVGAGSVFADIIESGEVPVARLTTLHRSAAQSWVATQAPKILAGQMPDLEPRADFRWIEHEDRDDAVSAAVRAAVEAGIEDVGFEGRPAQVIAAQNVGPAGTLVINDQIKARVNPGNGRSVKLGKQSAHVCDRVIQTRNDYTLKVMNGEIGTVASVGKSGARVRFEHRLVDYSLDQARSSLQLAYALSVHKCQGSEFARVVVFVHSTHTRMLSRALLYTATTRAKEGVILVGDRKGLRGAVRNNQDAKRNTGLVGRLRERVAA